MQNIDNVNNYFVSSEQNSFSFIHPVEGINPLLKGENNFNHFQFEGKLTSTRIRDEFFNTKSIVFETTDLCNLKCTYCGYGDMYSNYDYRNLKMQKFENAKVLIDYIRGSAFDSESQSSNRKITYGFYGGEPLLNFDFIKETVEYVEEKETMFSFTMTTNGVLLDRYMDFLAEKDFELVISLDGDFYNNSYRVFRNNRPSFNKVSSNIDLLRNRHEGYFKEKVNFNSVLHNRNSAEDVCNFFKRNFSKTPLTGQVNSIGISKEKQKEFKSIKEFGNFDFEDSNITIDKIIESLNIDPELNELVTFIINYSNNEIENFSDFFKDTKRVMYIPTSTCIPFSKRIYLTVNNKLFPCERIGHSYPLGKITSHSVMIDFEQIADFYNGWFEAMSELCQKCYVRKVCPTCMYKNIENGKLLVCKYFKDKSSFERSIAKNLTLLEKYPCIYEEVEQNIIRV